MTWVKTQKQKHILMQIIYTQAPSTHKAVQELQEVFYSLQSAHINLKLILNVIKTEVMVFSKSHLHQSNFDIFTSDGKLIEIVTFCKYFGIWINDKLSFM